MELKRAPATASRPVRLPETDASRQRLKTRVYRRASLSRSNLLDLARFPCTTCKKGFATAEELLSHGRFMHNSGVPHAPLPRSRKSAGARRVTEARAAIDAIVVRGTPADAFAHHDGGEYDDDGYASRPVVVSFTLDDADDASALPPPPIAAATDFPGAKALCLLCNASLVAILRAEQARLAYECARRGHPCDIARGAEAMQKVCAQCTGLLCQIAWHHESLLYLHCAYGVHA